MIPHPLHQNPDDQLCEDCGDPADEYYEDAWLCMDCIVRRIEQEGV